MPDYQALTAWDDAERKRREVWRKAGSLVAASASSPRCAVKVVADHFPSCRGPTRTSVVATRNSRLDVRSRPSGCAQTAVGAGWLG